LTQQPFSVPPTLWSLWQEEVFNSVVHGAGLLLAVIGAFPLLHKARAAATTAQMMGLVTYIAALIAFFASSTLQHSLHLTDATVVLRLIDHSAIYALIAGTVRRLGRGRGEVVALRASHAISAAEKRTYVACRPWCHRGDDYIPSPLPSPPPTD
jgi:hypothetical protein